MITKYLDNGKTLSKILNNFRKQTIITQPDKVQVQSFIKSYRKKRFGDGYWLKVTVEQFLEFAEAHYDVPDDVDEAFVLDFDHSSLDQVLSETEDGETNIPWIRLIISTKRLLLNSAESQIIHEDGTYKLNVQRYPILVFGTTDRDSTQHFHLMALMLCKTETKDDYAFGFKAIKNDIRRIHDKSFDPKVLMADADGAIHNGFVEVFGEDTTILM